MASAGLEIDTDGIFDEHRVLVAWLFGAIVVLIAVSSALVARRRTETKWVRWLAWQGVASMVIAVAIGALPHDPASIVVDGERRDLLCGPVLNLIRTDPTECGDRMDVHRFFMQAFAIISLALLVVARVYASVEHRSAKRAAKSGAS